ncbi:cysteine hydrolase family protein (plasmid) [Rhizobium gallicum bv. gallicum R602sp]|uniref:Cysteine hydrolase family protein n=1 Tax=Rhizobium gallicum bv. gallicum R602sp TaxID=1041138 RepID=A0A0B4X8V8_9HYPH|nr:cysteine hydrolase family protein [Rhizobium gallicum bv. gallicum R602sp]
MVAARGGLLFPQITEVFPGQEVIDRTFINTWEDQKVVDAVKATGQAADHCRPVDRDLRRDADNPGLGEAWDVTVITDASGGTSVEAHEVPIQRMIAAGANMMPGWRWHPSGSATGPYRKSGQDDGSARAARGWRRHRVSVGAAAA